MEKHFFISHATEDKETFVKPLAHKLNKLGCKIWYDEFELKIGDSLSQSIDNGLAISKFGIVVLSPNFFQKKWPARELAGLVAKEVQGEKVILPIWHQIEKDEIIKYSPTLADKIAIKSEKGIDFIASELANLVDVKFPKTDLEIANVYFGQGDYKGAILLSATYLEKFLRQILIDKLTYNYFKKRPLHAFGLRGLFDIATNKSIIKTKNHKYGEINIGLFCDLRNKIIHAKIEPSFEQTKWFIEEVEKIITININSR